VLGGCDGQKPVPTPEAFSQKSADVAGEKAIILAVELNQMFLWINVVEQLRA